jgi:hypothetical protein
MINNEILGEVKKTNYFCDGCRRIKLRVIGSKIQRKFKRILR